MHAPPANNLCHCSSLGFSELMALVRAGAVANGATCEALAALYPPPLLAHMYTHADTHHRRPPHPPPRPHLDFAAKVFVESSHATPLPLVLPFSEGCVARVTDRPVQSTLEVELSARQERLQDCRATPNTVGLTLGPCECALLAT